MLKCGYVYAMINLQHSKYL